MKRYSVTEDQLGRLWQGLYVPALEELPPNGAWLTREQVRKALLNNMHGTGYAQAPELNRIDFLDELFGSGK